MSTYIEKYFSQVQYENALRTQKAIVTESTLTAAGVSSTGAMTVTSSSANALTVGLAGATNPAFQVDASTASSATGIKVKSAAAAGGVAVSVVSSGTNENLTLDAKGSGTITIAGTSTGNVTVQRAMSVNGTLQVNGSAQLAAGEAVAAGGNTNSRITLSSTAGLGVYFGSGAPTVSAAQGSLYMRTDGSSTSTRLYVNTDGATTWTNVTTAA